MNSREPGKMQQVRKSIEEETFQAETVAQRPSSEHVGQCVINNSMIGVYKAKKGPEQKRPGLGTRFLSPRPGLVLHT